MEVCASSECEEEEYRVRAVAGKSGSSWHESDNQ